MLLLLAVPIASAHPVDVIVGPSPSCGKFALVGVSTWVDAWLQQPLDPNNPDLLHKFNSAGRVAVCPGNAKAYVPGGGAGPLSP